VNVRDVGSNSIQSYKWYLSDLKNIKSNGYKVFSCFAGGGGSSMGYKLAGFDVLGGLEIDKIMALNYRTNLKPKYFFEEDIRHFKQRDDIPDELFHLDILDGSPPCSVFSMSGLREKAWGKEKVFKEGQTKQRLDDLFFHFLDLAERLRPKIIVAENVIGLIRGNAKGYTIEIGRKFRQIGYDAQLFLLNSATMGLPQRRERVFFIAKRNDLKLPKLQLHFNYEPVPYREIEEKEPKQVEYLNDPKLLELWHKTLPGQSFSKSHLTHGYFNSRKLHPNQPVPTIPAFRRAYLCHYNVPRLMTTKELVLASTFPLDYHFLKERPKYIVGMSVPPLMIYHIARQIQRQWLDRL